MKSKKKPTILRKRMKELENVSMNIGAKMMKLEKIVDDISKNTRQNSSEYTEDSFHALYDLDRVTLSRKTK